MCFFKNWNNKLAFNFAPSYHKNSKNDTCLLFDGFDLKVIIFKKLVLLRKKIIFRIWKKYSKGTLLFQNLKSYIFVFLTLFDWHPRDLWGRVNSGDTRVLRFVLIILWRWRPLADFSLLWKCCPMSALKSRSLKNVFLSILIATIS